ncbi:UNVERIFIED_CONTAM: hypothetical protein Sindi_2670000, partial [Sesamum indicum]
MEGFNFAWDCVCLPNNEGGQGNQDITASTLLLWELNCGKVFRAIGLLFGLIGSIIQDCEILLSGRCQIEGVYGAGENSSIFDTSFDRLC